MIRDYQQEIVDKTAFYVRHGGRAVVVQSPTGSGKTVIAGEIIKMALSKNSRVFFLCHRKELITQAYQSFRMKYGLKPSVISAGYTAIPDWNLQICSIDTLRNRLDKYPKPNLVIVDECHHCSSASWTKVIEYYKDTSVIVGFTATPERLDGKGLPLFDKIIKGPQTLKLIEDGHLSPYTAYSINDVDMTGAKKVMGDYAASEVESRVNTKIVTGSAVEHYRKYLSGKKALIFCRTIKHSMDVCNEIRKFVSCEHIDGNTPKAKRADLMSKFRQGQIRVISNVSLFGEGLDVGDIAGLIMLRPTQSLSLYLQMVGRVLRPAPGKDQAIILDHVGNMRQHGLPCKKRFWTLRPSKLLREEDEPKIKVCPKCNAANSYVVQVCSNCGHKFPVGVRDNSFIQTREDLVEIEKDEERKKIDKRVLLREQGKCRDMKSLVELGRKRGYAQPEKWAVYILRARTEGYAKRKEQKKEDKKNNRRRRKDKTRHY